MSGSPEVSLEAIAPFVVRILETGKVWYLENKEGVAWCPSSSYEDLEGGEIQVVTVWSDKSKAQKCAVDDWKTFRPASMGLEDFVDGWLIELAEQGALLGTDWNEELVGQEVEPMSLHEFILDSIEE